MTEPFIVAAAQYPIDAPADWDAYAAKITGWVAEAAAAGAALAVFPEYGVMELAALDPATAGDLGGSLASVAARAEAVEALHSGLARTHGIHILAASGPALVPGAGPRGGPRYVNRARLFAPSGAFGWQDKLVMTRFEAEQWFVSPGTALTLFDTALGRIGVAICYDSEFPLIARALAEAGADLLLVPSCTDSLHGYWRVRIGSQARALENQIWVVQSPTVGMAAWSPAVDENHGAAGVYGPSDRGFPADGVVALGQMDAPGWVCATIDPAATAVLRVDGGVLNARDWATQWGAGVLPAVSVVRLD